MTNPSHNIIYGGQHPNLRTSKFASAYGICDLFEGNAHMVTQKRELLVSPFIKFEVTLLKTWKLKYVPAKC